MRKLSVISFAVLFAAAWIGFFASDALAIPAFARKYGVNCNKCHTQIPQLTADGIRFKQNGYRQPDEVGKLVWEEETFPLGALMKLRYNFTTENKQGTPDKGFFDPHELEIFGAGPMAPNWSYFFEVEGEFEAEDDETKVELGEFFGIWNDAILENSKVNVRFGRFNNEYLHFSDHLKLTAEGYLSKNVTFSVDGIEIDGLVPVGPGGLNYALGVVNDETGIKNVDNNFRAPFGWASYTYKDQTIGVRGIFTPTKAKQIKSNPTENNTQFDTFFKLMFNEAIYDFGLSDTNPAYLIFSFSTETDVGGVAGKDRQSFVVEPTVFLGDKWVLLGRYELNDDPDVSNTNDRFLFHIAFHPFPNIKAFAEYMHTEKREPVPKTREDRLRVGFLVAF